MTSGGARARSGPGADPNALRRNRKDDKAWVRLPSEGRKGRSPVWPLDLSTKPELELWRRLWRRPQAVMWEKLHLHLQVAAYVRAFLESTRMPEFDDEGKFIPGASAGLKTAVLRMEAELGLSTVGMNQLRWLIVDDELGERRAETPAAPTQAATAAPTGRRARLSAV